MIDTHCHLTKKFFERPEEIINRARESGVEKIICIGTNLEDSAEAIEIANKFDGVFATIGIHPSETCDNWDKFEKLAAQPRVVGIGECGLDYKIGLPNQKEVFIKQIEITKKLNLSLVIHCREAQNEIKEILDAARMVQGGILHCFAGGIEIPNNFYVSFAGNITFKNAVELREVVKNTPMEKIILETDSPFLAPHPLRGSINEPKNVTITAQCLADIKGLTIDEIEKITTENAEKLFPNL